MAKTKVGIMEMAYGQYWADRVLSAGSLCPLQEGKSNGIGFAESAKVLCATGTSWQAGTKEI